ncbi:MAG TPA: hypothetical protein VKN82_09080 [Desulfohalobiaceae bacterium]|nr:hypothetical protein [Desulfohalobiaceae bacterium]
MEMVIELITDLIEHLRLENQEESFCCFYCGGSHATVNCKSPRREAFYLSLMEISSGIDYEDELLRQIINEGYRNRVDTACSGQSNELIECEI